MRILFRFLALWAACTLGVVPSVSALHVAGGETVFVSEALEGDAYISAGLTRVFARVWGDLIAAGGTVTIDAAIEESLYVAGGDISIERDVKRDAFVAGGTVRVSGDIGDDLRIAGGTVTIGGDIAGDLIISGGTIRLLPEAVIMGDALISGGTVELYGEIRGATKLRAATVALGATLDSLDIDVGSLFVEDGAEITGDLVYRSRHLDELEAITVGESRYIASGASIREHAVDTAWWVARGLVTYQILVTIALSLILFFVWQGGVYRIGSVLGGAAWRSFWTGLLYFAAMPVLILLLFATVIGIPVGLFALFVYIFSFVFAKVVSAVTISGWILGRYLGGEEAAVWMKLLVVIVLAIALAILPFVDLLFAFFAFGAVILFLLRGGQTQDSRA